MNAPFEVKESAVALTDAVSLSRELLSPVQAIAYERLCNAVDAAPFVALTGECGSGRTTLLRLLAEERGGEYLTLEALMVAVRRRDVRASADSVLVAIEEAFERTDLVVLEDVAALTRYSDSGGTGPLALDILAGAMNGKGKRLVVAAGQDGLDHDFGAVRDRLYSVSIGAFGAQDYRTFLANALSEVAIAKVDMNLVWRHASGLSGHNLHTLAGLLLEEPELATPTVIQYIDKHLMASNVRTEQVEALSFANLPGTEAIAAKLETHIMLPLEQHDLARKLDIRPKRGALLYGPPGTGKTSIGRALAHRMKGKFFLIDGSFTTEPPIAFFSRVTEVVREAKENAPSVLFVDDADVLFGIEHIAGFARYLLSLLDGVESESAGRVCLMMTAMNASRIPGSILRSGRVELWLETQLPDEPTRAAILGRWLDEGLPGATQADLHALAQASDGFTPADLRRVVTDARSLHAMDLMAGRSARSAQAYLEEAIAELYELRAKMADNLNDESLRIASLAHASGQGKSRAAKYAAGIGGLVSSGETCSMLTGNL